jgi:hypothetical protein
MNDKNVFENVPVEPDTKILGRAYADFDGIPVLVEHWFWDGIYASSCIVPLENLKTAGMDSDTMIKILKDTLLIEGETTEKETGGFLFLNFNFQT